MSPSTPVVYLLQGEDEFAIARFVSNEIEGKLGDPSMLAINTTRLDGRSLDLDELNSAASAMPFLCEKRLVILTDPLARLTAPAARQKFLSLMEKIPPSTVLVVIEYFSEKENRDKKRHEDRLKWLEKWGLDQGDRVVVKKFSYPKGDHMVRWVLAQAKELGGQLTPAAARELVELIGENPRHADQEIHKLLEYVNYRRPVEPVDIETLTADVRQGDIFVLVGALGNRDGKQALAMLHRLLEERDAISIFSMIVRQFRNLLLAREVIDRGGNVAAELKVEGWQADRYINQARRFSLPVLEEFYRQLLDCDIAMKTGKMEGPFALYTLVASFTQPK